MNKNELSHILGKSLTTLSQWQKDGMPAAHLGGCANGNQYDTGLVIEWLVSRQPPINQPTSMDDERLRKIRLEADILNLEFEQARGNLIPAVDVEAAWSRLVSAFRAKILSLPTGIADELLQAGDLAHISAILKKHLYEALSALAAYDPADDRTQDTP